MKTLTALIKREYWEHQATLLKLPAILGFIIIFAASCASLFNFTVNSNFSTWTHQLQTKNYFLDPIKPMLLSLPFSILLWFIVAYYFLSCLYDDRKDGSVLFWQSLPIANTQTLASKLITGLIVAPILSWICILITSVFLIIIFSLVFWSHGDMLSLSLSPLPLLSAYVSLLLCFFVQGLWLLPIFAWCLFCSAYVEKAPLLKAILIPTLITIAESFFTHAHTLSTFISQHIAYAASTWAETVDRLTQFWQNSSPHQPITIQPFHYQALLTGLAIATIFIVAAGVLRKRAYRFTR